MLLSLEEIFSGYGDFMVLLGVSGKVDLGERLGILGPNGAGKSTLLKTIIGLTNVKSGKILFEGKEITNTSPHERVRRGIALVPEGRHIFPKMTVYENLETAALTTERGRKQVQDTLELVYSLFPRLKERVDQKAGTLSGGEQQMLAISRSLMTRPKLLMLDEPSQGLAPKLIDDIYSVLERINKEENITTMVVEQHITKIAEFVDRIYVLERGRMVYEGSIEGVMDKLRTIYVA